MDVHIHVRIPYNLVCTSNYKIYIYVIWEVNSWASVIFFHKNYIIWWCLHGVSNKPSLVKEYIILYLYRYYDLGVFGVHKKLICILSVVIKIVFRRIHYYVWLYSSLVYVLYQMISLFNSNNINTILSEPTKLAVKHTPHLIIFKNVNICSIGV